MRCDLNNATILAGHSILVTRTAEQTVELTAAIRRYGGKVKHLPLLNILPVTDIGLSRPLHEYSWLIFISANAVEYGFSQLANTAIPATVSLAAIGQTTAQKLADCGQQADLIAPPPFNSESLLNCQELQQITGLHILLLQGDNGRSLLADTLRARGALVDCLPVYRRECAGDSTALQQLLQQSISMITIASGQTLDCLLQLTEQTYHQQLFTIPLIVLSQRIADYALELGFQRVIAAKQADQENLLAAILACAGRGDISPHPAT